MGTPTLLDAGVLAPAAILGLLGVWLGFGRSLVAWPMRWLIPLFGGCAAALPAILYLAESGAAAELLSLSGTAATAAVGAISFVVTVVLLAMFMDNLRERMTVWTGSRRIGLTERVIGALFGIACGLLLVAVAYLPMPRRAGRRASLGARVGRAALFQERSGDGLCGQVHGAAVPAGGPTASGAT